MGRQLYGMEARLARHEIASDDIIGDGDASWLGAGSGALAASLATLLATAVELLVGRFAAGEVDADALFAVHVFGHLGLIGAAVAFALALVGGRVRLAGRRAPVVVGAALLAGAGLWLGRDLFSGPGISADPRAPLLRAAWWIGWPLAALAFVTAARAALFPRRTVRGGARALGLAALAFGCAATLQALDARVLTEGYGGAHRLAALLAGLLHLLAAGLGVSAAGERAALGRRGGLVVAALLLVSAGGALTVSRVVGDEGAVHRRRALAARPGFPLTRRVAPFLESGLFDRIWSLRPFTPDAAHERLESLFAPDVELASRRAANGPGPRDLDLVLIAVDTLRADRCGFLGAGPDATPNLDRFAATATVFERAYTPYPTSNYAYSSVFAGVAPRWSPARRAVAAREGVPEVPVLPELLSSAGWDTAARTAFNRIGTSSPDLFGHLRRGFGDFDPAPTEETRDARDVVADALAALDARPAGRRSFLWVQLMDPHVPYRRHEGDATSAEALYAGEIRHADRELGALLERLDRPDRRDRTIVVVFADHGEAFGEHNTRYHNSSLFEEQIRVPLLMRVPGARPGRRSEVVSLVDLGPTLLGELGLETPATMTGRDLGSLVHETAAGRAWEGFAHVERYPRDPLPNRTRQVALVTKDLKAIGFAGDPSPEVYDLSRDPGERHNVFDPGDRRQREILGLLRALEERQDGGRVARASRGAGIDATPEFLDDVTARLEDADTGNDVAAVHELGAALFRGHRRRFARDVWEAFPAELRERLARALCVIGSGADRHPRARVSAFEILLDLPGDVASDVMARALTLPQPEASYPAALWFAERGDRRGLELLRAGLRPGLSDWASRIAPTLARLGDLTVRPWLEPRLFHEDPAIAADAIGAFGALAPRDLGARLREVGLIGAPSATHPRVRLALVEAARGAADFDGLAVLLGLTFAEEAVVQTAAREALAGRLEPARAAVAREAIEATLLGDEARRGGRPGEAAAHWARALATLRAKESDDPGLALRRARALAAAGDETTARSELEALVRSEALPPAPRATARGLLRVLSSGGSLSPDPSRLSVSARLEGDEAWPKEPNVYGARAVTLTNNGPSAIVGGVEVDAPRLALAFRPEDGGPRLTGDDRSWLMAGFLPVTCLEPGESTLVCIPTSTPHRRGRWVPELLLLVGPFDTPATQVLATLPAVEIF